MSAPRLYAPHRLAVAPLMGWTDRHFRYLLRLISRGSWLYSEMVPAPALLRSAHASRMLDFHPAEHPVALQLAGDDPAALAQAACAAWQAGYDEINLNIGCPSSRVVKGGFGVCLMEHPERVGTLVASIRDAVPIPVTVKCRLGFNDHVEPVFLERFVETVAGAGCGTFFVHARSAWLDGLSPRHNRSLPPLDYESVIRLKQKLPHLEIVINGGIAAVAQAQALLTQVDGVMVGRKILEDPLWLATLEHATGVSSEPAPSRLDVVAGYGAYIFEMLESAPPSDLSMLRLFQPLQTVIRGFAGAARIRGMVSAAGRASRSEGQSRIVRVLAELSIKALPDPPVFRPVVSADPHPALGTVRAAHAARLP